MKKNILFFALILMVTQGKAQYCPNGDFENWNIYTYGVPDSGWYNSNPSSIAHADSPTVWSIVGVSGQAIHIQTAIVGIDTLQAYVINTQSDPQSGRGGIPYSQKPTTINGYYRYSIVGGDSAMMIIKFKKSGAIISTTQFAYRNASGSMPTFTPFSFPLATIPSIPDSVIIGLSSSNLQGGGLQSGSWVEIDELAFGGAGITQPIPGGSFDTWKTDSVYNPTGWAILNNGFNGNDVSRSNTHYSGYYSVQLFSELNPCSGCGNPVQAACISTGQFEGQSGTVHGGEPYTLTGDTLSGYYIYTPSGADTANVSVTMMAGTSMVGSFSYNFFAAASWTYFELPIFSVSPPDTIRIDIQSGSWNATTSGSVLNIDHLQLRSQPLDVSGIPSTSAGITAFPNPVTDILNLRFNYLISEPINIVIYDMMGRVLDKRVFNNHESIFTLPVGNFPSGMYFYQVSNNSDIMRGKFLKN